MTDSQLNQDQFSVAEIYAQHQVQTHWRHHSTLYTCAEHGGVASSSDARTGLTALAESCAAKSGEE